MRMTYLNQLRNNINHRIKDKEQNHSRNSINYPKSHKKKKRNWIKVKKSLKKNMRKKIGLIYILKLQPR